MTSTPSLVSAADATEPSLLNTDVLRWVKRTREQREKILDEFERSGVSGCKFASLVGVKYQTFATRVQERRRRRRAYAGTKPKLARTDTHLPALRHFQRHFQRLDRAAGFT